MNLYLLPLIISALLINTACVKQDGKIKDAETIPGTSGGSSSGSSGGGSNRQPDPLASEAWHIQNTAQKSFSSNPGTAGEDISLKDALDQGWTGKDIRIAVSDSGAEVGHEDLSGNQLSGEHRNYAHNNPTYWHGSLPLFSDDDAHGTAVSGLISAVAGNGLGSHGVAPGSKFAAFSYIIPYSSSVTSASILIRTIDQTDGDFDIFNYSYGYTDCFFVDEDPLVNESIRDGVTNLRNGKGALYVQAAGNGYVGYVGDCLGTSSLTIYAGNTNSSSDLATPHKIIAAAVNANGVSSSYSTPGSGIWISAPGGEYGTTTPAMVTTDISGCSRGYSVTNYSLNAFNRGSHSLNSGCNYTSMMNGTSSATPVTSGVIALMLEANPALSWRDVKHILAVTADKVDFSLTEEITHPIGMDLTGYVYDLKWVKNAANLEFSNWYGFGRINALTAVLMANNYTFPLGAYETTSNPNHEGWYYDSGTIAAAIPDNSATGVSHTLQIRHNFFVEAVQLKITTDHPRPSDLAVHLISPSGTESRLLLINSNLQSSALSEDKLLLTNAFYGEESLGNWTIKVVDGSGSETGSLTNWKIQIHGHRVAGDGSYPNPVSNISLSNIFASTTTSPPFTFTASNSVDVSRYEVSVGTYAGATDVSPWESAGINTTFQILGLQLANYHTYYVNVRAIDQRENASSIRSASWQVSY